MTVEQYHKALKKLDLTPAGKRTAELLGLSVRQLIRLSNQQAPIPKFVPLLLRMYLRHGAPKD